MVGCNSYRNPALLAKITSTIDVISGGRLDWGIGAGWYENEYRGVRLRLPEAEGPHRHAPRVRRDRALDVDRARDDATRASTTSSCGPTATRSRCSSRTRRSGSAAGESSSRCASSPATPTARNFGGKPEQWAHKRDVLREHCAAVGRDPDEIRMTWSPEVFIRAHARPSSTPPGRRACGARAVELGRRATSSARPSRWPRRSRPTSTSAAGGSSRGAPTTPTPSRWSCSPPRSCPVRLSRLDVRIGELFVDAGASVHRPTAVSRLSTGGR